MSKKAITKMTYNRNNAGRHTVSRSSKAEIEHILKMKTDLPDDMVEIMLDTFEYTYQMDLAETGKVIRFDEWLTQEAFEEIMLAAFVFCGMVEEPHELTLEEAAAGIREELDITDEEAAKELLEHIERTESGTPRRCTRCGEGLLHAKKSKNARSKYADVCICSKCQADEKRREKRGYGPLAFTDWDLIQFLTEATQDIA